MTARTIVVETTTTECSHCSNVTAMLIQHAHARPNDVALHFESQSLSWLELERTTRRLGLWFNAKAGNKKQIALCLPNSITLAVFFVAGVRAGFDMQVFDNDWPAAVVDKLATDLCPDLLIDQAIIPDPYLPIDAVVAGLLSDAHCVDKDDLTLVSAEAVFYTGFTSGSSGVPKGFRRTHASWLASFDNDQIECSLTADDVIIAPGALSHSLFMYALMRGLHTGVAVVLCRRFSARNVAREIAKHSATVLYSVPAHIGMLIRQSSSYFDSIRRVFSSGAKWPENWQDKFDEVFLGTELCEFYGASELSFVSIAKSTETVPKKSVGRAFHGVRISIRDARGAIVSAEKIGHVFVESDMLFSGHAGCNDGTQCATNKMLTVGDLGYLDPQGFLFLVGRADRMIVCAGKNIYPEEVESVLLRHDDITAAAVVAQDDDKRGQRLLALIQARSYETLSRAAVIAHCKSLLPMYKVPTQYAICKDWPMTRSGKTDFKKLQAKSKYGFAEFLT